MTGSVLIIGEDPARIDFGAPGAPPNMSAQKVMAGLNGSRDRLIAAGHDTDILLTKATAMVEDQIAEAMSGRKYDVIVIGSGLRAVPTMAEEFEKLMNALHRQVPSAHLAFNSAPDDSDAAALRWL